MISLQKSELSVGRNPLFTKSSRATIVKDPQNIEYWNFYNAKNNGSDAWSCSWKRFAIEKQKSNQESAHLSLRFFQRRTQMVFSKQKSVRIKIRSRRSKKKMQITGFFFLKQIQNNFCFVTAHFVSIYKRSPRASFVGVFMNSCWRFASDFRLVTWPTFERQTGYQPRPIPPPCCNIW